MNVFIVGINGFIGFHLFEAILEKTDWFVYGLDMDDSCVMKSRYPTRLEFLKGSMRENLDWIEEKIQQSDVVIPLAAIATPALYIKQPLKIFEVDFEDNMKIVKLCAKHNKRIVFPSTSEVYGMSVDSEFVEDTSNLVVGPICKQRWIYSSCKQLIDRVIWALGLEQAFSFTLFRPFNWVGPRLDNVYDSREGYNRVVTQFISNIIHNNPLKLVNGGKQKRCFTYIADGIDCLMKIIENKNNLAHNQIFNIGNPDNHCSIEFVANYMIQWVKVNRPEMQLPKIIYISDKSYYGESYEDVAYRLPNIAKAVSLLGWKPTAGIEEILDTTLEYYLGKNRKLQNVLSLPAGQAGALDVE